MYREREREIDMYDPSWASGLGRLPGADVASEALAPSPRWGGGCVLLGPRGGGNYLYEEFTRLAETRLAETRLAQNSLD